MPQLLKIQVNRIGDPPSPPLGVGNGTVLRGTFTDAIILECGTQEGQTTISFFLTDENGNQIFAEMTKGILDGLHAGVNGADWRFKNVPNSNLQ